MFTPLAVPIRPSLNLMRRRKRESLKGGKLVKYMKLFYYFLKLEEGDSDSDTWRTVGKADVVENSFAQNFTF